MRKVLILPIAAVALMAGLASCASESVENLRNEAFANVDPCDTVTAVWDGPVQEIITRNCAGNYNLNQSSGCHQTGASRINFDSYTNIRTVVDNDKLENRIFNFQSMPPDYSDDPSNPGSPLRLSDCDKTILRNWLDAGAPEN